MQPTIVTHDSELVQILDLQRRNLKQLVSDDERLSQGFVTMQFNLPMLKAMNDLAPSIIITDNDVVVAYAITLLREGVHVYPAMEPMFAVFATTEYKGRSLLSYNLYVMGQICIDREYRGKGLFTMLYEQHREQYGSRFELIVTEISTSNLRSLRAHEKIGFVTIHTYRDEIDEWAIVAWDFNV